MNNDQAPNLYRIQFVNNGKNYQLYVKELKQSSLFGFIEIADYVFDNHSTLLVDPSEEKLKTEFSGVARSYIPLHSVIRIDLVSERGSAKITELDGNIMTFPHLSTFKPKT